MELIYFCSFIFIAFLFYVIVEVYNHPNGEFCMALLPQSKPKTNRDIANDGMKIVYEENVQMSQKHPSMGNFDQGVIKQTKPSSLKSNPARHVEYLYNESRESNFANPLVTGNITLRNESLRPIKQSTTMNTQCRNGDSFVIASQSQDKNFSNPRKTELLGKNTKTSEKQDMTLLELERNSGSTNGMSSSNYHSYMHVAHHQHTSTEFYIPCDETTYRKKQTFSSEFVHSDKLFQKRRENEPKSALIKTCDLEMANESNQQDSVRRKSSKQEISLTQNSKNKKTLTKLEGFTESKFKNVLSSNSSERKDLSVKIVKDKKFDNEYKLQNSEKQIQVMKKIKTNKTKAGFQGLFRSYKQEPRENSTNMGEKEASLKTISPSIGETSQNSTAGSSNSKSLQDPQKTPNEPKHKSQNCPTYKPKQGKFLLYELFHSKNITLYKNSLKFNDSSCLVKKLVEIKRNTRIFRNYLIVSGTVSIFLNNELLCVKGSGEVTHGLSFCLKRPKVSDQISHKTRSDTILLPIFDEKILWNERLLNLYLIDFTHMAVLLGCKTEITEILGSFAIPCMNGDIQEQSKYMPRSIKQRFFECENPDILLLLATIDWHILSDDRQNSREYSEIILKRKLSQTLRLSYTLKKKVLEYFQDKLKTKIVPISLETKKSKKIISIDPAKLEVFKKENISVKDISSTNYISCLETDLLINDLIFWTKQIYQLKSTSPLNGGDIIIFGNKKLLYSRYGDFSSFIEFMINDVDFIFVGRNVPADYTIKHHSKNSIQLNRGIFTIRKKYSEKNEPFNTQFKTFYNKTEMFSILSHIFDLNFNVIFSSGGARGPIHCGVLEYLKMMNWLVSQHDVDQFNRFYQLKDSSDERIESYLPLRSIGGTSIGAITARLYLEGSPTDDLRKFCSKLSCVNIFKNCIYERFFGHSPYYFHLKEMLDKRKSTPRKSHTLFHYFSRKAFFNVHQKFTNEKSINTVNCPWWATCTDTKNMQTIIFCSDCSLDSNFRKEGFIKNHNLRFICMKCNNLDECQILRGTSGITQFITGTDIYLDKEHLTLVDGAYTLSLPVIFTNSIVIDISQLLFVGSFLEDMMKTEFFLSEVRSKETIKKIDEQPKYNPFHTRKNSIIRLEVDTDQSCLNFTKNFDDLKTKGFSKSKKKLLYYGGWPRRWSI